jgi:hypothetical protein
LLTRAVLYQRSTVACFDLWNIFKDLVSRILARASVSRNPAAITPAGSPRRRSRQSLEKNVRPSGNKSYIPFHTGVFPFGLFPFFDSRLNLPQPPFSLDIVTDTAYKLPLSVTNH